MEDLPNLLQRDYGLKPQGKSAPMSAHKSSAGNSTGSGSRLNVYDDVFGGPPKFTAPSFASHSEEGYDDIFRSFSTSTKSSSVPVFDAPVYDDDIFGGIKGVRSSTVTYDDVFSGGSGGPSSASFEDLLGEFGGSGKPSAGLNSQRSASRGDSGFDGLIPGFGNSEPAKKNRSAAESKPRQRVTSVLSAGSPRKAAEFPFVVLEPKPLLSNVSSAFVPDPLEQLKVSPKSASTKEKKASSNGATRVDGINAFDGFPLAGPAVSSPMNKSRMANSPLKASQSSSPTHTSGNKELAEGKSVRKSLLNSHPVKDYTKPYAGVHTADIRKSGGHSNTTRNIPSPRRHRQPLHENSTYVSNLNARESLPVMKSEKGANFIDEVLVTVAEIKLLTQPTALPPPSRPPPPLVIKQGPSSKKPLDSKADGNSYSAGNSDRFPASLQHPQPHRYGKSSGNPTINELEDFVSGPARVRNEVAAEFLSPSMDEEQLESSSAAAASAAAMKEAMERAEARLKLAKEARERKREDSEREVKTGKSKEKERQERKDARAAQEAFEREEKDREVKAAREAREREEREREELERERRQREREREKEREREREREREKDRLAVERANQEARERAAAEARERAERAAVERATAEARERAAAEARDRAAEARERAAAEARDRAAAEARERAAAERAAAEAKLRAERAAVDRANSEARERAAERAAVEKAASQAKERAERAVAAARERQRRNENDLESFFGVGVRPNSAPRQRPPTSDATSDAHSQNRGFSSEGFQKVPTGAAPGFRQSNLATNMADDWTSLFTVSSSEEFQEVDGESADRRRARLERHQRTRERAAKALAEKNDRDLQVQREQAERHRLAETLDADVKRWATGKEGNLRALLSTLQYVLWPESGWQPVSLTDVITAASVKKVYRKATLCVHPDKVQQKGATLQQKYIAEKVFDLLKEAWNKFNAEELF